MKRSQPRNLALISSFRDDFEKIIKGIKNRTAEVKEYKMFEEMVTHFSNIPSRNAKALMVTKLFPVYMEKYEFSDMYDYYEKTKKIRCNSHKKEIKEFKKIISLAGKAVLQILDEIIKEK